MRPNGRQFAYNSKLKGRAVRMHTNADCPASKHRGFLRAICPEVGLSNASNVSIHPSSCTQCACTVTCDDATLAMHMNRVAIHMQTHRTPVAP